jgi:hypothetical protein
MARKAVDLAAKKKAKQQKIAIGGFVLLLAVMAFSVPKTLKMLKGPQPVASPTTQTAPATPAPATGSPPEASADAAAGAAAGATAVLVDTASAPEPAEGQLVSFERFESKDPFTQQVTAPPQAATPEPATPEPATPEPASESKAADAEQDSPSAPAPSAGSPPAAPPVEPTTTPTPAAPAKPTAAVISVNGVRETVQLRGTFPAAGPMFELVAITATAAKIGIAGGSLTGGAATVTLEKGKKVTLMNTADETQYELVLVSLS